MKSSSPMASSFSIRRLRNLILLVLVVGVAGYTALMFSLSDNLARRFGPQVRVDLMWRTERGAQELARTVDVGLALADRALVEQSFGAHARSADVQAIVAVGATGDVVAQHGKAPEPREQLFSGEAGTVRESSDYLVSWAPSKIEDVQVGKVAVVVSTRRLHEAHDLLARSSRTTLLGGFTALLLGVVVVGFFTRAVAQRDAQLSDYAANLERKVEERTRQLDERNRGMSLVLDNVAQGFITVDLHGRMAQERSAIVDRWFGAPAPESTLASYLGSEAGDYGQWLEIGLEQLRDGFMPTELVLDQLPKRFSMRSRTHQVSYTPINTGDTCDKLLVIISDVTEQLAREKSEREQKELVGFFQRVSVDRQGVEEFLSEAAGLVGELRKETDPVVQKRLVHTLKGNCSIYGLDSYAELSHAIENELAETGAGLSDAQRARLVDVWKQAMRRVGWLLGTQKRAVVEIGRSEIDAAKAKLLAGVSPHEVVAVLNDWTRQPVVHRFERLGRQATALARRLGKPEPKVEIGGHDVRIDGEGWAGYWSSMVHILRNAVDHGIESPETRALSGKPEVATLTLSAERRDGQLIISVQDDGPGIDWEAVRRKAAKSGLPSRDHADLVRALFTDGISTHDEATEISGRGVGLSAVRESVEKMGGQIVVESTRGRGTTFRFCFDERAIGRDKNHSPQDLPSSLMPTG